MQQYWNIKKDHFDSVVLVRFGKWYFVYFHDLLALNEVSEEPLNLNYQLHGFHHTDKDKYIELFLKKNYRVVVVEQTETTNMMLTRIENEKEEESKGCSTRGIVHREIEAIYTKGTYQKPNEKFQAYDALEDPDSLDNNYVLMYLFDKEDNSFGFTYFDVSTLKFHIGQFIDDSMLTKFRTLVSRVRPVEVVCDTKLRKSDMVKMLQATPLPPAFRFQHSANILAHTDAGIVIEHYL